ncbi:indolepyruvate ferredoxin oxidoreductase subunit alpha [Candidatus Syntrophosphaera thermopropionivorans]|jgi:NAD-dependent dihydropyrimidine dehydrogenase PreA subunit|uniref:4Fe-4S dicluster domain-containing protein n=1 Tax=Candidatus Syntrophosphaera thermopropionivorans TaxID=2593015 RepID=A0AC61QLD4_9BACT|nr:4Fe-4S binding protein [Candidatus Syntrophosphaera thermopropionivorans]TDF74740.1 4Fe-4S dicluster domain-containing protein [Candidatus Syntrophosphaera thermopropionivorans]
MAVKIDKDICIGCAACIDICPTGSLSMQEDKAVCDEGTCIDCGSCIPVCPVQAISE